MKPVKAQAKPVKAVAKPETLQPLILPKGIAPKAFVSVKYNLYKSTKENAEVLKDRGLTYTAEVLKVTSSVLHLEFTYEDDGTTDKASLNLKTHMDSDGGFVDSISIIPKSKAAKKAAEAPVLEMEDKDEPEDEDDVEYI